ncbi:MAG: hypothetical protein U1D69_09315, partial [Polynucleobacter sp.]|nr:hypothetical protein [Polynucleobacter sp.]
AAKGTIVAGDMEDELKRLRDGEHRHNLMQAICRSNVRNHVGDVCGEATVYIIADKRHEPDRLISETFPGCHIHRWEPVEETLKGAELAVFNAVLRAFEDPSVVTVSKGIIGTRIGLPDKQAMRRILQKDGVKSALKPFGIGVVYKAFVRIVDG